jgi:hypothetical protein
MASGSVTGGDESIHSLGCGIAAGVTVSFDTFDETLYTFPLPF